MKSITRFALAACLAVVATACNPDNPKSAVELAGARLAKSDTKGFTKLLTGPAAVQYASIEAIAQLEARLEGYDLRVGSVKETASTRALDLYVVTVLGTKGRDTVPVLEATVECRPVGPSVTSGAGPGLPGTE